MRGKWFLTAAALAIAAVVGAGAASAQTVADSVSADAPNSDATQIRIAPSANVQGVLSPAGDADWYRLRVREGRLYTLALSNLGEGEGALADPLLRVIGRDGEQIAVNDDNEGSLNSQLRFAAPTSGDVFVEARGFQEDAAGAYTLTVAETVLPPDDAGNTAATRARIGFGDPKTGALEYPQDKDWYRIRLEEGQSYRFTVNSAEGAGALDDPLLRVIGPDGEEAGRDDDGGEGFNAYLEFTAAAAGNYFLEVSGFNENAVGAYVLTANEGDIPGDKETDAALSPEGDMREGLLAPAGDRDWFRLPLTEGETVRIALDSSPTEGVGDPLVAIYDAEGQPITQDDDGGEGLNAFLEFTAPAEGDYYVEARGFSEEAQGRYTLTLTSGEIGANAESADMIAANGEGRTSVLQTPDDVDWFAIQMVEGRPYRLNLAGAGEGEGSLADPLLTLFDAEGHQVAIDDDGGPGLNAYVTYTSVTGGVYYAAVSSFNAGAAGQYSLSVVDTDVAGNPDTDENLDGAQGDERASVIDLAGDKDYYRVELEEGVRYEFALFGQGENPLADPFLTLSNSAGEQVTSDDDSGPGLDARIRFRATASDVFYLQASGLGGATGGYRIVVNRLDPPPAPKTDEPPTE
jgi:hypothetical protein